MKKKTLIISLISAGAVIIACVVLLVVALSLKNNPHTHTMLDMVVEPTCTSKGYIKHYCSECDYHYEDSFIDEVNHVVDYNVVEKATCQAEGLEEGYCEMCNKQFTRSIPKRNEHISLEVLFSSDFCGDNQVGYVTCKDCGEIIDVIGHNLETVIESPSCKEAGKKTIVCINCDLIVSEIVLNPLNHIHVEEIKVESTCKEEGKIDTFCVDCGEILSTEIIGKDSHNFTSTKTDNLIKYQCSKCGYMYESTEVENSYKVTLVSKLDDSKSELEIKEGDSVLLPVLNDYDYTFLGWYYEEEGINVYNQEPIYDDVTLYGLWQLEIIRESYEENTIERNVSRNYTFSVTSIIELNNSNINEYVKVVDSNDLNVSVKVKKENTQYIISSNDYVEGETYFVIVSDPVKLTNRKDNIFYFSVEKENMINITYKDNVIILNEKDIVNYYESDDKTYIYTKHELIDKNNPYVLIGEKDSILGTYEIENVSLINDYYVHECTDAKAEDVFKEFEIYQSGDIDIKAEYISYTLEEDITREFRKSPLYKQFNDAVDEFIKLETSRKYKASMDDIKPKFALKDGALIISIELKVRFSENNDEYLNIILRVENRIEIDADINAELFDPKLNGVIETENHFSVSLYARIIDDKFGTEEEEISTLKKFKEIYKALKEADNLKLKDNNSKDISRIKIYEGTYPLYGPLGAHLGIYANFEWATIGQFGATFTYHTNIKTLVNASLKGINLNSSVSNSSHFSAVLMGKTKVSESLEISLSVGVIPLYYIGLSVEAGPSVEMGGMVVLNIDENKNTTFEKSYYLEAKLFAKLNLVLESDIFQDYKAELINKDFPILEYGSKEIALNFENKEEEINLNSDFGKNINLNELIDRHVLINNFDTMVTLSKKVDCDFYLASIIDRYDHVEILDGMLTIYPSKSTSFEIKVAVIYNDLRKDVLLKIKINHEHNYELEILKEPSCYISGKNKYECDCGLTYEETVYPIGHTFENGKCIRCDATDNSKLVIDNLHLELMDDGTYEVVGYEGTIEHLYIPAGNEQFKITKISSGAFIECTTITSIEIEEGIRIINDNAFSEEIILTYISLPSSLEYCGVNLYNICPPEIMYQYENCYYVGNLINKYLIVVHPISCDSYTYLIHPETKIIGNHAFDDSYNLSGIELPEMIVSIGAYGFARCSYLSNITLSENIINIGRDAFYDSNNLSNIYFDGNIEQWCYIDFENEFSTPMRLANYIYMLDSNNEYYEVEEISIPNTIADIGNYQFYGFNSLEKVEIPSSVTNIGSSAFAVCRKLTTINIPDSVISIGEKAFEYCDGLIEIEIPKNVERIGFEAFKDCDNLVSMIVPFTGESRYQNSHLSYIFGGKENSVGGYSYVPYTLKEVIVTDIENISAYAFYQCFNIEKVIVESDIASIGYKAFYGCKQLKNIVIPETITKINEKAFMECESLENFNLPETLVTIGTEAFRDCNSLTSVLIPLSVKKIDDYAFLGCDNLIIYCEASVEPDNWHTYWNSYDNTSRPVYWGISTLYENEGVHYANNMQTKESIIAKYTGNSSELSLKSKIVVDGVEYKVTTIGEDAFENCDNLVSVVMPAGIVNIGRNAFANCDNLAYIEIPSTVENIGSYAFSGCSSLEKIIIPKSVIIMGDSVFQYSDKLVIYCESDSRPNGWSVFWNRNDNEVYWGCQS